MAHRGSRGIALPFLDHGTRRGWGVSVTPWPLFTPGKDPVPIVQEAGWAPEPVWTGAENLAPTGIQSPDCPACSQLLYWLSYPTHVSDIVFTISLLFVYLYTRCKVWVYSVNQIKIIYSNNRKDNNNRFPPKKKNVSWPRYTPPHSFSSLTRMLAVVTQFRYPLLTVFPV